jgi:hypothetical protein
VRRERHERLLDLRLLRALVPQEEAAEDLSPQIRGGSAPAAPMGAGRASSDSLSLPFSGGGGAVGLGETRGDGLLSSSTGTADSSYTDREDYEDAGAYGTPPSHQEEQEAFAAEEPEDVEEQTVPTLDQLESYLCEVLLPPVPEDGAERQTIGSVEFCVEALRACGIGLRDEEILEMLGRVTPLNEEGDMLDLQQVAQTAA